MDSYVRPVLEVPAIRFDGRKAIGAVSASFIRQAGTSLRRSFGEPVLCAWAADDHVFPLDHARRYAYELGADLRTIDDSCTYTAEDQPEHTAQVLADWLDKP